MSRVRDACTPACDTERVCVTVVPPLWRDSLYPRLAPRAHKSARAGHAQFISATTNHFSPPTPASRNLQTHECTMVRSAPRAARTRSFPSSCTCPPHTPRMCVDAAPAGRGLPHCSWAGVRPTLCGRGYVLQLPPAPHGVTCPRARARARAHAGRHDSSSRRGGPHGGLR